MIDDFGTESTSPNQWSLLYQTFSLAAPLSKAV
jgi:hypothetical protein